MGVSWTKEQQQVIDLRNRNILVSAAAGSGKTAVLVERIITRLLADQPPTSVDQLLIVTFTEAAAAEMKDRIRTAIEKALEKQPENEHLQRQATLIHSAQITTIHSFCLSVIRDHFHQINLDPGFRIAEEGELKLLKHEVLGQVLEEKYDQGLEQFLEMVEWFATGKNDKVLEEIIFQIYDYSRSYPQPQKWFDQCASNYEMKGTLKDQPFISMILEESKICLQDAYALSEKAALLCGLEDGPDAYLPMIKEDQIFLQELIHESNYEKFYKRWQNFKWPALSRKKQEHADPDKKEMVKGLRELWKKITAGLMEQYFFLAPEKLEEDMRHCQRPIRELLDVVALFSDSFEAQKKDRNIIDFGDMERFALEILTREDEAGNLVPTQTAMEYQEKFLEVMIDEYQDSNLIQESILTSVSRVDQGEYNIFMVGDVKQSIYRFRLSRPELFMDKYHTYSLDDGPKQRIDLHKNFRSRAEVLNATNYVFERIMGESFGKITYDDQAKLYLGADYEKKPEKICEVVVVDTKMPEDIEEIPGEVVEQSKRELEARAVAGKIRELIANQEILDKKTGTYRQASYRDIALLTRSLKGWTDVFAKVLAEEGIPTYTTTREGYFETIEVSTILDYLRILDNYRQDIPLASVLTSPIVGLKSSQLGVIRGEQKGVPFYQAVWSYAQIMEDEIARKLQRMIGQLEDFRHRVPYTAIHDLIEKILEETGYRRYVTAMPAGEQRRANIDMLVEKASAYEATSYKGLFNFIRYMEQLEKYEMDMGEANIGDETMDAVTMMSIHKSKGLEFPIVMVAGMGKQFNTQDQKGAVLIHGDLGIGIETVDLQHRMKAPTILRKVIQKRSQLDNMSEELRVLYVAMTRAKEKLVLIGSLEDAREKMNQMMQKIPGYGEGTLLPYATLTGAKTYLDWVIPAILIEPEDQIKLQIMGIQELMQEAIEKEQASSYSRESLLFWNPDQADRELPEELQAQLSYQDPDVDKQRMQLKFTVSELKKRVYLEEESGSIPAYAQEEKEIVPKFMQEEEPLKGASRGSAYHKFLELLDLSREYDASALQVEIERLQKEGYLSPQMAACIRASDMLTFLESGIGKRMQTASKNEAIFAEQPFVLGVEASTIYPEAKADEQVLVQGIIDSYFEENGDLVVVDYKTDRAKSGQELYEKYHAQLEYYGQALERMTGKKVKERIIYSFALGEEVAI